MGNMKTNTHLAQLIIWVDPPTNARWHVEHLPAPVFFVEAEAAALRLESGRIDDEVFGDEVGASLRRFAGGSRGSILGVMVQVAPHGSRLETRLWARGALDSQHTLALCFWPP